MSVIKVIGIGGSGCNIVNSLNKEKSEVLECIACDTNLEALKYCSEMSKIQIGVKQTNGYSAENNPLIGEKAAVENATEIRNILKNTETVIIAAGMGGGAGSGAAKVIAEIAKELNIYTVAVVTTPFSEEGDKRKEQAYQGIKELAQFTDSIFVIASTQMQNILGDLPVAKAFALLDQVIGALIKRLALNFYFHDNSFLHNQSLISCGCIKNLTPIIQLSKKEDSNTIETADLKKSLTMKQEREFSIRLLSEESGSQEIGFGKHYLCRNRLSKLLAIR